MASLAKRNYQSELRDLNWDFAGEAGDDAISSSHWYPARYIRQVPGILIGYFSEPGDLVLDPFCGSGTTLVEALGAGRSSIGIDTNPIATLMTRAKFNRADSHALTAYAKMILRRATDSVMSNRAESDGSTDKAHEERCFWFAGRTVQELESLWAAIQASPDECQEVALACFSAILRAVCSQDKHWGWICDNVRPRELIYRDALGAFVRKFTQFLDVLNEMTVLRERGRVTAGRDLTTQILTGRCETELGSIDSAAVDLVVTSPPYYGVTDYIRSQRLSFLWFQHDIDRIKQEESGARFKRFRKDALRGYMADMGGSFAEIARVLRPGKVCAVVLGESPSREPYLADLALVLAGLGLGKEDQLVRRIPLRRSLNPRVKTETIMILRRAT